MNLASLSTQTHLNTFIQFRQTVYDRLGPARDAWFELGDAVLLTPSLNSFVQLSTCPVFRRRWPSTYKALQDVYLAHLPATPPPLLAGDHTAWPRLSAYTVRQRTV